MKLSARNIPLFIVLFITVLVSAVLIYFVVIEHGKVSETNTKIEEYKRILEDANKKKPAPVTENFKKWRYGAIALRAALDFFDLRIGLSYFRSNINSMKGERENAHEYSARTF